MITKELIEKLLENVRCEIEMAEEAVQKGRKSFGFQDVYSIGVLNYVDSTKLLVHDTFMPIGAVSISPSDAISYFKPQERLLLALLEVCDEQT